MIWIAADQSRERLRLWVMSGQSQIATAQSDNGQETTPLEALGAALAALVAPWLGDECLSAVVCGLNLTQGSALKLAKVPCLPLSTPPSLLPEADPRLRIWAVPGLRQVTPSDLIAGPETRIAGFLSLNPKFDGVVCLPGPQSTWAHVSAGEIVSFQSFLTEDLSQALSQHTVLRHSLGQEAWNAPTFLGALDQILTHPGQLSGELFRLRAGALINGLSPAAAASRLSGLLIGAELVAARAYWTAQPVAVVGAGKASRPYVTALERQGVRPIQADGDSMTRAGLAAAQHLIPGFGAPN